MNFSLKAVNLQNSPPQRFMQARTLGARGEKGNHFLKDQGIEGWRTGIKEEIRSVQIIHDHVECGAGMKGLVAYSYSYENEVQIP